MVLLSPQTTPYSPKKSPIWRLPSIVRGQDFSYRHGTPETDASLEEGEDRPLILYVYHEKKNARQNARFFINHGLHAHADFIFILNGETDLSNDLPTAPNIKVIRRDNTCFDLGSYAEVLTRNDNELIKKYNKFILMNASIRGPFLPSWSRECWTDAWLAKVTDTNKLVGMTLNCRPSRHIQSMIFATDRIGLNLLLRRINTCFPTFRSAVEAETECTGIIMESGYSVTALMTAFASDKDYATKCRHTDVLHQNRYYGMTIHPYESMFQKANRKLAPEQLELLTRWHERSNYSSWDVCRKAYNIRKATRLMKQKGYDLDFGL
ncbi:hypothetical protein TWF970_007558 [Orbilia oligospora]|uniref:Uncharacterized protein n=1 Tax=Orbilia oligospora TaxID=2813651 RepID=A0A7C8VBL3_ORBOL|nr:hypothetical protein TWF970_007558 [Orbilia oligospora]